MSSFVILMHTHPKPHYDLLVDLDESSDLATWQIAEEIDGEFTSFEVRRISDHRRAYLTYEGEVSNNRGSVKRIDEGSLTCHKSTSDAVEITMRGSLLSGRFELRQISGDRWRLTRIANPS